MRGQRSERFVTGLGRVRILGWCAVWIALAHLCMGISGCNDDGGVVVVLQQKPKLRIAAQTFSVAENAAVGTVVGQVVASDSDGRPLTYSTTTTGLPFALRSDGQISVAGRLDFETTPSYTMAVTVNNGKRTASADMTLSILNVEEYEYAIVNLSTGGVTYQHGAPANLLTNAAYKETLMVMRRIPAGTFVMGSPVAELGRDDGRFDNEVQHEVTLTEDFYLGVFEVTQAQYQTVVGSNPSYYTGIWRPVELVPWEVVRGGTWPGGTPAAGSLSGLLRSKTGLAFDLPTEAQWEHACRAGTTSALNSGKNLTDIYQCPNMAEVGRYFCNWENGWDSHTTVGRYLPNAWGLYDMHGNVWEWCADWYADYGISPETDPNGPESGQYRVRRGGSWNFYARSCRSANRDAIEPLDLYGDVGCRLAFPAPANEWRAQIEALTNSVAEGRTVAAFRIALNQTKAVALDVAYTVVGTATAGADYTVLTGLATVPAGALSVDIPLTALADGQPEPPETVVLTLIEAGGYRLGAVTSATINISDVLPTYAIVNLSTGRVTYHDATPADLLTNAAYKETLMVMRRIPAGTFTMGSATDELGRYSDEVQHQVSLTQDFYLGVFEVTQAQYQAVVGSNPSAYPGNWRPVEQVSWDDVRGGTWPGGTPAAGSLSGLLRSKTGLAAFDLPTEAQWEYACRAGTTSALNSGKNLTNTGPCPNMDEVGRYYYNGGASSHHTTVGSYLPNAWGLYDMHGNIWEWCADWYGDYGTSPETDPTGPAAGQVRAGRGGSWGAGAGECRSALRIRDEPGHRDGDRGCRLAFTPAPGQ